MITELPLTTMIIIIIALAALLFILKKFALPKSFYKNQVKREELIKAKLQYESREKEALESDEPEDEQTEE